MMSRRSKTLLLSGLMLLAGAYLIVLRTSGPVVQLSTSFILGKPTFWSALVPFLTAFGCLSILLVPFSLIRDKKKQIRNAP
jgi:hypothetical protein